ncbi:MAG: hypothetical protein ACYSOW_07800 [Planctomycetota bacterium]|jgi:hypothetical protein
MASMMINSSVERAVLVMVNQEQERIVKVLAEKYGFDLEEAMGSLAAISSVEKKEVTPRKPKEDKPVKVKPEPKGKGKAKKEESDEPKPKKAKTGYLLFCDAARASARTKLECEAEETTGEKVMAKHVVTLLATCWKDLGEEAQAMWKERAQAIKEGRGDDLEEVEVELEAEEDDGESRWSEAEEDDE